MMEVKKGRKWIRTKWKKGRKGIRWKLKKSGEVGSERKVGRGENGS